MNSKSRLDVKSKIAAILFILLCGWVWQAWTPIRFDTSSMPSLRREIVETTRRMEHETPQIVSVELRKVVERYVKVGDKLDNVRALMKANDFLINNDPNHIPPRNDYKSNQILFLLKVEQFWIGFSYVAITVWIDVGGEQEAIKKIDVSFQIDIL